MLAELGQGVLDHSVFFSDTAARVKRSLPPIFRTVYGSDGDHPGQQVRDFHHGIKGAMPPGTGKAARYHALDPETYFWAHATFVEQVLYFADTFVKRLTDEEKEQIYLESKTWYRRYGVSDRPMPADYAEFQRYWDHMLDHVMIAHPTAKYGVGYVTKGFPCPKGVPPLVWRVVSVAFNPVAAFLTTGGLPPRARTLLGLPWSDRQERRYQRFAASVAVTAGQLVVGSSSDAVALQQVCPGRLCPLTAPLIPPPLPSSTPPSSSSNSTASAGSRSTT